MDEADDEEGSTEPERILDEVQKNFLTTMSSGLGPDYFRRYKGCAGNDGLRESI